MPVLKRRQYLGVNYCILIVLPYVVVYEDVLNVLVKGVDPQRFAPADGEGITCPPGYRNREAERYGKGWMER